MDFLLEDLVLIGKLLDPLFKDHSLLHHQVFVLHEDFHLFFLTLPLPFDLEEDILIQVVSPLFEGLPHQRREVLVDALDPFHFLFLLKLKDFLFQLALEVVL